MSNDQPDLSIVPEEADEILLLALYQPNSVWTLVNRWSNRGVIGTRNLSIGGEILRALVGGQPTSRREARRIVSGVLADFTDFGRDVNAGTGIVNGLMALELLSLTGRVNLGKLSSTVEQLVKRSQRFWSCVDGPSVKKCLRKLTRVRGQRSGRLAEPTSKPMTAASQSSSRKPAELPSRAKSNGHAHQPTVLQRPGLWREVDGRSVATARLEPEVREVLAGRPMTDLYQALPWVKAAAETQLAPGDAHQRLIDAGIDAVAILEALPLSPAPTADAGRRLAMGTLGQLLRPVFEENLAQARRLAETIYRQLRSAGLVRNGALNRGQLSKAVAALRAR